MRRVLLALLLAGCGSEATELDAAERGAELASDPSFSGSPFNDISCTTCHATEAGDPRILPGHSLGGAVSRPSYWGGDVADLKGAVDVCLVRFMRGRELDPRDEDARALYEYLDSLRDAGSTGALPVTVAHAVEEAPARGDPARGEEIHRLACQECHGAAHTGAGRIEGAPILPEQARDEAIELFPEHEPALVFTEKVRHGSFFGIGGVMPFFSYEALTDRELGALLAYYEL